MGKDNDEKEVAESIRNLLQVNEEFKIISVSDEKDLDYINKLVTKQSVEVNKLARLLLTTKKELQTRVGGLEQCKEEMATRINSQQTAITELQKTVENLQLREVKQLRSKLKKEQEINETDLETVNELMVKHPNKNSIYLLKGDILRALKKERDLEIYVQRLVKEQPKNFFMYVVSQSTFHKALQDKD